MHTPDFEVHRAVVHSSNTVTGEALVRIPSLLGASQVVSVPRTGLTQVSGFWNVPQEGASTFVAVSDDRTQFFWLTAVTTPSGGDDRDVVDSLQFNIDANITVESEGLLAWNEDWGTVDIGLHGSNAVLHVGQQVYYYAKNQTGSQIDKGTVVRFDGALGASGHLKMAPFLADGTYPSEYIMGVTAHDIPAGDDGYVVHFGAVRGIDTATPGWSAGDVVYASPTVTGGLTSTTPVAPNNIVLVAAVVNSHAQNGELFVRPTLAANILNDEGIVYTNLADNDVLAYNSTTGVFENTSSLDLTTLTTSGNVGIGTTTPAYPLDVDAGVDGNVLRLKGANDTLNFTVSSGDYSILNSQQSNGLVIYDGTGGVEVWYNGASYMDFDSGGIVARSTLNMNSNSITASGGIDGLTLTNGISGTNFNITGVNQLEIADPGEGIVWKAGASGDISLYVIDDASDNILHTNGTLSGERLRVGGHYIDDVAGTGNPYGSISVGGAMGWDGYSIDERVVFMHDGGSNWGIYNDVDNHWMIYGQLAGDVELRYNNAVKLTTSSTGVTISGSLLATGNVEAQGNVVVTRPDALMLNGASDNNHKIYSLNNANTALPWSDGPVMVGYTGWGMYCEEENVWRMGLRGNTGNTQRYGWYNCNLMVGTAPDDAKNTHTLRVQGSMYITSGIHQDDNGTINYFDAESKFRYESTSNDWSAQPVQLISPYDIGLAVRSYDDDASTMMMRPASGLVYFRNHNDSANVTLVATAYNTSSRTYKQDIESWETPKAAGAAVGAEAVVDATSTIRSLRPVTFRWEKEHMLSVSPKSERRKEALKRLNVYRRSKGLKNFTSEELIHTCGRDCDSTPEEPCFYYRNWDRKQLGFIAEEVAEAERHLAKEGKDGDNTLIDPMAMNAVIVKALQEIDQRLSALEGS